MSLFIIPKRERILALVAITSAPYRRIELRQIFGRPSNRLIQNGSFQRCYDPPGSCVPLTADEMLQIIADGSDVERWRQPGVGPDVDQSIIDTIWTIQDKCHCDGKIVLLEGTGTKFPVVVSYYNKERTFTDMPK